MRICDFDKKNQDVDFFTSTWFFLWWWFTVWVSFDWCFSCYWEYNIIILVSCIRDIRK
jgi:hypothetical protein